MSDFLKTNKTMLLGGVLVVVGVFAYFNFFSGGSGEPVVTSASDPSSPLTQDLLLTLTNLNVITLNDAIFKDPVFLSLSDFGVQNPPEERVGRRNPFAPVGSQ